MNIISMRCYNNVELSKVAAQSALAQVGVDDLKLVIINNGSTDGTQEWAEGLCEADPRVTVRRYSQNIAPTRAANEEMVQHFEEWGQDHYLGIPNDCILPPNLYREMLRWPRGIVTASSSSQPFELMGIPEEAKAASENTPMAVVLIRKWAWQALLAKDGMFFDDGFFHYASDNDFALRLSACGIRGVQLDIPYHHVSSATLKNSAPEQRRQMQIQADADREYFRRKWNFRVDEAAYGEAARNINFKGERVDGQ